MLEDIIGKQVKGYRGPSWSITNESKWAWYVLAEIGLLYDSSIFPVKNYLYGMPDSPRFIYKPIYGTEFYEVPASTLKILHRNIGFSGGFFLRILPYELIKLGIMRLNNIGQPAIIYIHPREIDVHQPRLKLNIRDSFVHYYGINSSKEKLENLLNEFTFLSIESYYFAHLT
ncbi:DUF3473 domain-containing protein [Syntrophomonas palmitatica]|uniref:DUF3473 domain-containing protein n=1 Tax=Syntrophomonas palmitatica TaxID=402877 RepID=UPI001FA7A50A|nr:DUF3473 domain-containing protein [Syntrophomonas palmitatica]